MTNQDELDRLLAAAREQSRSPDRQEDRVVVLRQNQQTQLEPIYEIFDLLRRREIYLRARTGEASLIPNGQYFRNLNVERTASLDVTLLLSPHVSLVVRPKGDNRYSLQRITWGKPDRETTYENVTALTQALVQVITDYEVRPRNQQNNRDRDRDRGRDRDRDRNRRDQSQTRPASVPTPRPPRERGERLLMFDDQLETPEE